MLGKFGSTQCLSLSQSISLRTSGRRCLGANTARTRICTRKSLLAKIQLYHFTQEGQVQSGDPTRGATTALFQHLTLPQNARTVEC